MYSKTFVKTPLAIILLKKSNNNSYNESTKRERASLPVGEKVTAGTRISGLKILELISPFRTPGSRILPLSFSSMSIDCIGPKSVILRRLKNSYEKERLRM